jgi:hypothetical protein
MNKNIIKKKKTEPESIAHFIIDETLFFSTISQSFSSIDTRALIPSVPLFVLTPHKNAVAVPAESGT